MLKKGPLSRDGFKAEYRTTNMQKTAEPRHLSVSIDCSAAEAYEFLCLPENFPKWASGLGSLSKAGGEWMAQTPKGPMKISFSQRNSLGVLDHWVFPASNVVIYVPMRIVANGPGSELIFTLFRLPGVKREQFDADAEWVLRDLRAAKRILEGK
jgi:hypothetical protein